MTELRASDADRERSVAHLREHAVDGRLTLEEFTERIERAYLARTEEELAELARDLPAEPPPSRRRPTRLLLSFFGSSERAGRIRVGRRVTCLSAFGSVDLDLRQASMESEVVTIVVLALFGAVDAYVPEGVEVDLRGLAVFGHNGVNGNDQPPRAGTPLVRVVSFSCFAGIDVWRVPSTLSHKPLRDVIRGIRSHPRRELGA